MTWLFRPQSCSRGSDTYLWPECVWENTSFAVHSGHIRAKKKSDSRSLFWRSLRDAASRFPPVVRCVAFSGWTGPTFSYLSQLRTPAGKATPPPPGFERPVHSATPRQFVVRTFGSPVRLLSSPRAIRLTFPPPVAVHPLFPATATSAAR